MKFDSELGTELSNQLQEVYPELPQGKPWIKYGKQRIYFNEKEEGIDYGFNIEFHTDHIEINDFLDDYWLEKLDITTSDELQRKIEEIYYQLAYPLDTAFPATTIREITLTKRFEGCITSKNKKELSITPLFVDITITIDRNQLEEVTNTTRTKDGNDIYRFQIKDDYVEELTDRMSELEDEADRKYMAQISRSLGSRIKVDDEDEKHTIEFEDKSD